MSQTGPWSVKGIDQRAREAARDAATAEGMTLGEYLNRLLMASETSPQPNEVSEPYQGARPKPDAASSTLDRLTRRIEATEARSTLAITGMDQSILGLLARLENAEQNSSAIGGHVESLIDELRSTHEALQRKVDRLESDDSAKQNLDALKSLEHALGKLASHVYEENEMAHQESDAIKGRVEAGFSELTNRVESMETKVERTLSDAASRVERAVEQAELRAEGTARHLSERMSGLESHVNQRLADVGNADERLSAVEEDVSGALESMESTLLRIQDRLNRAENTTDTALKHLESTFTHLDERIEAVASTIDPELADRLRAEFEARFEDLTRHVRETVSSTRLELAGEIAKAASGEDMAVVSEIKSELSSVSERLALAEERQSTAMETVSAQVGRMSNSFDERIREVEARDDTATTEAMRTQIEQLGDTVSARIDTLADQLDERVTRSEERSADAIEQIGDQVASVAGRLQKRQDEAIRSLKQSMDEGRKQTDGRLSDALASVSERLELMQTQSAAAMSPVQRAIASLATRLEAVEDFSAPPFSKAAAAETLPPVPELPVNPPLFEYEADAQDSNDADDRLPADMDALEDVDTAPDDDAVQFEEAFEAGIPDDLMRSEREESYETVDPESQDAALEADPFEAGLESWLVAPDVEQENPYDSDFSAIKAAAASISGKDFGEHNYVADVPGEHDGEDFIDPVAELEGFDEDRTEVRDSDVFDTEDTDSAPPSQSVGLIDDLAGLPEFEDPAPAELPPEQASDYIARARRAAIAASSTDGNKAKPQRSKKTSVKGGSSKLPLLMAASAVVVAGAAGGLYLRGKQAPPAAAPAKNVYVDPGLEAVAAVPVADAETVDDALVADETDFAFSTAAEDVPVVAEDGPVAAEDDLFDPTPSAAPDVTPAPVPVVEATSTKAPVPAATFPPIPPVISVEAAASSGDSIAQFQLAQDRIAAGDYQVGADFMRKSAQKGAPMAQYGLAKLHEKGTGVPKDLTLAREWTEKAAQGGNVKAMHDLAVFMAEGEGGSQSYAGAVEWFRKGAEYGVVDSQYNLGILYEQGLGISPNLTEALFWFEVAGRNGDAGAPAKIAELKSRVSTEAAAQAKTRADTWSAAYGNAIANGRFGVQPWNTGNPLQVKGVQTALNALGFPVGTPDGVMGNATTEAIRKYQSANRIEATGTITPELIDSLNAKATKTNG